MQLFEVADMDGFPMLLRTCMVAFLDRLHDIIGSADVLSDKLSDRIAANGYVNIQDFCSGHGGLAKNVFGKLRSTYPDLMWNL